MRILAFALALLVPATAAAKLPPQAPPPDPSKGETYDGRPRSEEGTGRSLALAAPRIATALPRVALRILRVPVMYFLNYTETRDGARRNRAPENARIGISPAFTSGSGLFPAFGARVWARDLFGPGIAKTSVWFLTSGPTFNETGASISPNRALPLGFGATVRGMRRTDEPFYGMAGEAPVDASWDELDHRVKVVAFDASLYALVRPGGGAGMWRYRLETGFGYRDYGPPIVGEPADPMMTPGFAKHPTFVRAGLSIERISPFDVSRGTSGLDLRLGVEPAFGVGVDESRWVTTTAHAAYGIPTSYGRAFILGARVAHQHSFGDEPVTFWDRITLGGTDAGMRGFRAHRFRGDSAAQVSLDYRFPIYMSVDGFLFVEEGGVWGKDFAGFGLDSLRTSFGGGTRFFWGATMLTLMGGWGVGDGLVFGFSVGSTL